MPQCHTQFPRRYPQAAIVLTGCYAQLRPAEASLLLGGGGSGGVNDKLALADMALDWLERRRPHRGAPVASLREFMPSCARGDRTRFFLKVQDGCDYWCLTAPFRVRGRSRSGTIADIVAQAEAAAGGGKRL